MPINLLGMLIATLEPLLSRMFRVSVLGMNINYDKQMRNFKKSNGKITRMCSNKRQISFHVTLRLLDFFSKNNLMFSAQFKH